ncbi:MAG TPA: iron-sulfur cluster carrier protein ApbC [Arenimonas sp.]|nr:iron-sulfur cluster carrier protein ApbC [Arenimonas sp.]
MSLNEAAIRTELTQIIDSNTGLDLIASNAVRAVGVDGQNVAIELQLNYPAKSEHEGLISRITELLKAKLATKAVSIRIETRIPAHKVQKELSPLPGVKNIIAVASGKGGVGKSTTSVNLALALAAEGANVGILDADIHGPSIPMMLGISGKPDSTDGKTVEPKMAFGLQAMSIGLFLADDTPTIWRGPMTTQYLQQLLTTTNWNNLDYLIIDLPPGTGDIQLTLAQRVPVSAAIIVTTPQDIALIDAKKALKMFEKVEVPVLGVIENMAMHVCSSCGHADAIFGEGGGAKMAEQYATVLLGQLPLQRSIREQMDSGTPTVVADPDGVATQSYKAIARLAAAKLSLQAKNKSLGFPNIVIQNT